jgi:hypothetical protein
MTTLTTHNGQNDQVLDEAHVQTLVYFLRKQTMRCGHSFSFLVRWDTTFCGLCFLREGYHEELPKKLHLVRTLADNGNPQQTDQLQGHLSLVEGIYDPGDTPLRDFSRARSHKGSAPLPQLYPFASALWGVMGKQPPLGLPLYRSVLGVPEREIASFMEISLLNVNIRLSKGVDMAVRLIRKYDHDRERDVSRAAAKNVATNP